MQLQQQGLGGGGGGSGGRKEKRKGGGLSTPAPSTSWEALGPILLVGTPRMAPPPSWLGIGSAGVWGTVWGAGGISGEGVYVCAWVNRACL